jgi:glycosyltransferase involved in cell wall biosynthesis
VGDFVAGYESYHAWLWRELARLGVRSVTLAGWQDDPFAFYRHADLCVLPSVSEERLMMDDGSIDVRGGEGFPRTHLEAMAAGLPVVGTRIAGVPEQVVDGETGLLVAPGDADGLASALEALITDPERRARLGAAGRARVAEKFSTQAYVDGVTRVYDEILG